MSDRDQITHDEQALHDELMDLLAERTANDGEALGQIVLAGVRLMAQHMDADRACEAFLETVRLTVAEMRH